MAEQLALKFEFRANQTFDDYFPGGNLEIIHQLKTTLSGSGENYIFLWGDQGHGKSHLLQACCHAASRLGLRSFYLDFSITLPDGAEVFAGLEEYDLVCFDNIDRFPKSAAQELALFNFYNRHRDRNHRLILTASCPPNAVAITLPDLLTRLNWGLALKINALDDNEKIAALSHKARQMGFELSPKAVRFLLTRYDRSLSSLWSALNKLDTASLAAQRKLTIPFLKEVLNKEL